MRTILIVLVCLLLVVGCRSAVPPPSATETAAAALATAIPTSVPSPTPFPTITPTPQPERHTTLLMGTDFDVQYPERVQFGERTDVLVVVTWVETWEGVLEDFALISLPRDLWVKVPCSPLDPSLGGYDRTNAAYAYGGFECVRQMVEENFGLVVDQPMFLVQMRPFMEVIRLFEPLRLSPKETYRDWCGDFLGTDGRGRYKLWTAGVEYTMDPNQLMCYLRGRQGAASGDLDRNRRALEVLQEMARQYPPQVSGDLASWGPGEYVELWGIFSEHVQSDIQITDIPALVHLVPQVIAGMQELNAGWGWRTVRFTLEETDFWRTPIYNASVLLPTVDLKPWIDCVITSQGAPGWDDLRKICTGLYTLPVSIGPIPAPTAEPTVAPTPQAFIVPLPVSIQGPIYADLPIDRVLYALDWCDMVRARPYWSCVRMALEGERRALDG